MKSLANYAAVMSVQGHHCRLIELKLCNLITCIGGKTGGLGANWGPPIPGPSLQPRLLTRAAAVTLSRPSALLGSDSDD